MNRIVVYTAIFGNYDGLIPQPELEGVDFICFTDQELSAKPWRVIKVEPPVHGDNTRSARYYKILPHKVLPAQYDLSVWMDGNFIINQPISEFVTTKLQDKAMWVFNHASGPIGHDCPYVEKDNIVSHFHKKTILKDDLAVMDKQMEGYLAEGFPKSGGLLSSGVLLRRHKVAAVIETMELWWHEVKNKSKRDQLSFNYAAWKTGLKFGYIQLDVKRNNYFYLVGLHRQNYKAKLFKYRLKKFLGLLNK